MIDKERLYILNDFGTMDIVKRIEILNVFLQDDDELLFCKRDLSQDELNPEVRADLKEFFFEMFINGGNSTFNDPNTEKQIYEEINKILYENLKTTEFSYNNFNKLEKEIQENIKEIVYMYTYRDEDPAWKKFVDERAVFINNIWGYPWQERNNNIKYIWFHVKNHEELLDVLGREFEFACIVLKKGSDFSEYKYSLLSYDEYDDGHIDLLIIERKNDDFINNIIPKIKIIAGQLFIKNSERLNGRCNTEINISFTP